MADSRQREKRDSRKETETHRRDKRRQRRERHDFPDERKPRSRSRSPHHERYSGSTNNHSHRRYSSDSPKRLQSRFESRQEHDHNKRQNNDEKFIKQEKIDREPKEKRENEERATREQRHSQEPEHKRDRGYDQDMRWGNEQRRDQSAQDDIESPEQDSTENPSSNKTKDEPDFGLSGKLAAETNTFQGVVIKYSEPREARVPKTKWRFYMFKGDEYIDTLYLHRQSAYLIGRDRKVVDFPIDHPSCSKQHAVLQYRLVEYVKDDGRKGRKVKPYIIDLDSTNGTYINNQRLDPSRYVEIKEKDMVKFGFSTREYVLLHENSKDSDDDEVEENPD